MAYNNRNQGYNNRSRQGGRGRDQAVKRSACYTDKTKDGAMYLYGWKSTRNAMLSFSAFPPIEDGDTDSDGRKIRGTSGSGRDWERWLVKFQSSEYAESRLMSGFFYPDNRKLIIPELRMVANPNAPSGYTSSGKRVSGYFGTYKR